MQPRMWGNEYRTTVVCIDSYERRVPEGRFYNQYYPDGVRFYGAIDFLRKMENILDLMRFPQSFSRVRTFADVPVMEQQAPDGSKSHEGELATLAVRVLFRQKPESLLKELFSTEKSTLPRRKRSLTSSPRKVAARRVPLCA